MPRSPTPKSSLSGVIMPRTMFLSISSMRSTRPSTHIGSVKSRTKNGRSVGDGLAGGLVGRRGRDVGRQAAGDDGRGAGLVVGVEVEGRRVGHGVRFCTTGCDLLAIGRGWSGRASGRHARSRGADRPRRGAGLVALAVAAYLQRRQRPPAPIRTGYSVPAQVDRADFDRPEAPWLVAVFTSATCSSCAGVWERAQPLASDAGGGAGARARPRPGAARPLRDRRGAGHARGRRRGRGGRPASSGR